MKLNNTHVVTGYSLQLSPRDKRSDGSTYEGEWMSELLSVNGSDRLCVTLTISAPKRFKVLAKLFSRTGPKTVYDARDVPGSDSGTDLLSMFEVSLSADDGNLVQLAVYVTLNVAIKTANISSGQCPVDSMYLIYISEYVIIESHKSFTNVHDCLLLGLLAVPDNYSITFFDGCHAFKEQ